MLQKKYTIPHFIKDDFIQSFKLILNHNYTQGFQKLMDSIHQLNVDYCKTTGNQVAAEELTPLITKIITNESKKKGIRQEEINFLKNFFEMCNYNKESSDTTLTGQDQYYAAQLESAFFYAKTSKQNSKDLDNNRNNIEMKNEKFLAFTKKRNKIGTIADKILDKYSAYKIAKDNLDKTNNAWKNMNPVYKFFNIFGRINHKITSQKQRYIVNTTHIEANKTLNKYLGTTSNHDDLAELKRKLKYKFEDNSMHEEYKIIEEKINNNVSANVNFQSEIGSDLDKDGTWANKALSSSKPLNLNKQGFYRPNDKINNDDDDEFHLDSGLKNN